LRDAHRGGGSQLRERAMDLACCASPRKGGTPTGPLGSDSTRLSGKDEPEEELGLGGRALSLFGGKPKAKKEKEATSGRDSKRDDDDDASLTDRALSIFGAGKKKSKDDDALPPNWKKAKDKDGKIYYFNSVTQVRQSSLPRPLPKGWTEALHKESNRVYYVHKATRKTTFAFPQEADGDDDDGDDAKEDGIIGKTLSFATGGLLGKKKKEDESIARTSTIAGKAANGAKKEGEKKEGEAKKKETTVFISCTTLIKEVKLCVDASKHPPLDALLDNLVNHKIAAEVAVKHLQQLVGTTLVQQAGMSVKNAKTGVLPHGWLEYTDERSGRSYYYNVHTKTTTWYKPKKDDVSEAAKASDVVKRSEEAADKGEAEVKLDFDVQTHNVAMTGFI